MPSSGLPLDVEQGSEGAFERLGRAPSRPADLDRQGVALDPAGAADDSEKSAAEWDIELGEAAKQGSDELKRVWESMPKAAKKECEQALRRRHQPTAAQADEQRVV